MIPASKKQKQVIAILTKGDKDLKRSLVQNVTNDESKISTNDLTHTEANEIIYHLGGKPLVYDQWALFDKHNKQHRTILSLCMQYGWSKPSTNGKSSEVADLYQLSEWLKYGDKCPVHKPLKKMDTKELSKVILALEAMVKWKYNKRP